MPRYFKKNLRFLQDSCKKVQLALSWKILLKILVLGKPIEFQRENIFHLTKKTGLFKKTFIFQKLSKTPTLDLKSKRFSLQNSIGFFCYSISYLMVKSDLKKSIPFKSYSKNSESRSREFLINMSIFVLQRYLCYEYWAMCYEVYLMCYNRSPIF